MVRLFFIATLAAAGACLAREATEVSLADVVELKRQPITIQVYTSENCAPCRTLKAALNEIGVSYTEQDFYSADKELNVTCTPTLIVFRGNREIGRLSRVEWTVERVKAFLSAAEKL